MRMRHNVTCVLSGCTKFYTLSHKGHDFRKKENKVNDHEMYVLIFATNLSETFLILRKTGRDMRKKNVYWSACVLFYVLFVCKCVLYCWHRVATQLQLTDIPYHILSYHIYHHIIYIIIICIISYVMS